MNTDRTTQVQVEWKYNNNYLDVMAQCWRFICNNKLFVKRVEVIDIDSIDEYDGDAAEESEETLFRDAMLSGNRTDHDSEPTSNRTAAATVAGSPSTGRRRYSLCGEIGTKYTGITSGGHVTLDRHC